MYTLVKIGMMQSRKIAVTGGSGSGKSEALKYIGKQGFHVFSCDEIYAELLNDKVFIDKLFCEFGGGIFTESGMLDRKRLSQIVFKNSEALNKLNSITHPEIMRIAVEKMEQFPLSFCEVPLLFEGGYENLFDGIIVILRDREERILSLMKRDGKSREEIINRLNSQYNYDNCEFAEYYVIHNNGNLSDFQQQILKTINQIKEELK